MGIKISINFLLVFITFFSTTNAKALLGPFLIEGELPSPGSAARDTCGQNRTLLGNWFIEHGSPDLLLEPLPPLVAEVDTSPYLDPSNPPSDPWAPSGVCGVAWSEQVEPSTGHKRYTLANFTGEEEAQDMGFTVTHKGHCGACSSLQDLGVYIRQNLTDSTRECGLLGSLSSSLMRDCLLGLGFSLPCVTIWEWNIINTKEECFQVCMWSYITGEPNNKPDGSLNDCLQCDEDKSGPNFKYFSGRTRRNSGIPSAIQRPPDEVYNMEHCYWYGDL